jgi:flagellar basal body rod protein FlgG
MKDRVFLITKRMVKLLIPVQVCELIVKSIIVNSAAMLLSGNYNSGKYLTNYNRSGWCVSTLQAGSSAPTQVGQIELAQFINPGGLNATGKNLFLPTAASGEPITGNPGSDGLGTINQGFLELSNVNVVEEMVNMIVSQRAYELNSKVVQSSDEMLATANNIKR